MQNEIIKTRQDFTRGSDYAEYLWRGSRVQINTIVNTVREPFLILDNNLVVVAANETFYRVFQVEEKDTENKHVYELGNAQWNIPSLRKLLEDIFLRNTFFNGFEVDHEFPFIGHKVMMLSAYKIYTEGVVSSKQSSQIILLTMEDVTSLISVAETFVAHTNQLKVKLVEQIQKTDFHVRELEKEIGQLKKK